jgi:hypothetical protein
VVATTRSNYRSLAGNYEHFCALRRLQPWPADHIKVCAWVLRLMTRVKPTSLKVYLAAVRYAHINRGYAWTLTGHECLRRVLRYVKRNFPCGSKGLKAAVTMAALRKMLPLLPGWPRLSDLSFDDLVFACASVVGVCGFLRGGEFLFRKGQARPILLWSSVQIDEVQGGRALVVRVPQAKAEWWKMVSCVPIFATGDALCPLELWQTVARRSPHVRADGSAPPALPAFHTTDGAPLQHKFMTRRTLQLMRAAGISLVDDRGQTLSVMASSWRAGGVRSAVEAGVGEAAIMELGRWHSSAWTHYIHFSRHDLRRASARMWQHASSEAGDSPHPLTLRVGAENVGPGPQLVRDDEVTAMRMVQEATAAVPRRRAATKRKATCTPRFSVGMKVRVRGARWGVATVRRVNRDATYNLEWAQWPGQEWSVEHSEIVRAHV